MREVEFLPEWYSLQQQRRRRLRVGGGLIILLGMALVVGILQAARFGGASRPRTSISASVSERSQLSTTVAKSDAP